jgi:hypothetical protein
VSLHYFLDALPQSIIADGQEVRINTDFRAILRYDRLTREDPEDPERVAEALSELFPDDVPTITEDLIGALEAFIGGGEGEKKPGPSKKLLGVNNNRPFDFIIDDRLIWSAFFVAFRINLREIDYLHWWDFLELMNELPESVRFEKIIHYRTIDTKAPGVSKEQKKVYDALQKHYKIAERVKTPQDLKIEEALRNGLDPAQFLENKG